MCRGCRRDARRPRVGGRRRFTSLAAITIAPTGYGCAMNESPLPDHQVPDGVSPETVDAVGKLTKALETTERARGHLYAFHQLIGESDRRVEKAVQMLRD